MYCNRNSSWEFVSEVSNCLRSGKGHIGRLVETLWCEDCMYLYMIYGQWSILYIVLWWLNAGCYMSSKIVALYLIGFQNVLKMHACTPSAEKSNHNLHPSHHHCLLWLTNEVSSFAFQDNNAEVIIKQGQPSMSSMPLVHRIRCRCSTEVAVLNMNAIKP